jgi:hypothetical protein
MAMSSPAGHLLAHTDWGVGAVRQSHLMPLHGTDWCAWTSAVLRGAGFPAEHVLRLAAAEVATLADALIEAEDQLRTARDAAFDAVRRVRALASERRALNKAKKQLVKMKPVDPLSLPDGEARALAAGYCAAHACVLALREQFRQAYATADEALDRTIRDAACAPLFREALIWQNRGAYHRAIEPVLARPHGANSSGDRTHRMMVASYLQRYCLKNDTIGFFGPVGWIGLNPHATGITSHPGAGLVSARGVFFEVWCIDALCATLSGKESLLPWMAPRPVCRRFDAASGVVHVSGRVDPIALTAGQVHVLQACDGWRTAEEIARALAASHASLFDGDAAVYAQLTALRRMNAIAWRFEVASGSRPEVELRRQLERITNEGLKTQALNALAELDRARGDVAAAAGNPEALDAALDRMDRIFTRMTGEIPTRRAGQTYAGRTLVFEDCRRDLALEIGADVVAEIGRPMSLLLRSARWLSGALAARYRTAFETIHARLAAASGSDDVAAADFLAAIQPLTKGNHNPVLQEVLGDFRQRWAGILAAIFAEHRTRNGGREPHHVHCTSDEIRDRVEGAFPAQSTGWDLARTHTPDLMIAAESLDAIRRGEYSVVLGEFHIATNTLDSTTFLDQHPAADEILRSLSADMRQTRIVIPRKRGRGYLMSVLPDDYWVESDDRAACARSRALPVSRLVISREGGGLVVRTREGRPAFDVLQFFGRDLSIVIVNAFKKVIAGLNHVPRFTIDRLVVCRERWCFSAPAIAWAAVADATARFAAARRWARETGLSRSVFVKSPVEQKPFYVDFDSPIYVSMFGKMIRRTVEQHPVMSQVVVTEMLPSHEGMWLQDRDGRRYACELRIPMVDRAGTAHVPERRTEVVAAASRTARFESGLTDGCSGGVT